MESTSQVLFWMHRHCSSVWKQRQQKTSLILRLVTDHSIPFYVQLRPVFRIESGSRFLAETSGLWLNPDPIRVLIKISLTKSKKKLLGNVLNLNLIKKCFHKPLQRTFRLFKHKITSAFPFFGVRFWPAWIRIWWPNWIRIQSRSETLVMAITQWHRSDIFKISKFNVFCTFSKIKQYSVLWNLWLQKKRQYKKIVSPLFCSCWIRESGWKKIRIWDPK